MEIQRLERFFYSLDHSTRSRRRWMRCLREPHQNSTKREQRKDWRRMEAPHLPTNEPNLRIPIEWLIVFYLFVINLKIWTFWKIIIKGRFIKIILTIQNHVDHRKTKIRFPFGQSLHQQNRLEPQRWSRWVESQIRHLHSLSIKSINHFQRTLAQPQTRRSQVLRKRIGRRMIT